MILPDRFCIIKREQNPPGIVFTGNYDIKMRMQFLIFFSIVLGVYALVNVYIFIRGLQALEAESSLRTWFIWIFWALAASYVAGRFLERIFINPFTDMLIWTGSFWLAAMLFFFLLVVVFDLGRLINLIIPYLPEAGTAAWARLRFGLFAGSIILVAGFVTAGFINARSPRIITAEVHLDKPANGMQQLHAVVMSDIHLGTLIGNGHLQRIIHQVNLLQPDIILLAGDILDEDLEPVIRQNVGETLKQLQAPLGVYGVMGNHEYIGGAEPAYKYLTSHGITMLRDTVITINDSFVLAGREDRDKNRFTGRQRMSLEALLKDVDFSYPVILMDHQPFYLEDAAQLGVDLQLSGHTHNGQLWPISLIINAIYTLPYGLGMINGMHAYVSSGVGTWGPPVRIGSYPEILSLTIHFAK